MYNLRNIRNRRFHYDTLIEGFDRARAEAIAALDDPTPSPDGHEKLIPEWNVPRRPTPPGRMIPSPRIVPPAPTNKFRVGDILTPHGYKFRDIPGRIEIIASYGEFIDYAFIPRGTNGVLQMTEGVWASNITITPRRRDEND